jgi:hypothetical protein
MLLDGNFQDEDFQPPPEEDLDLYNSRPVAHLMEVLLKAIRPQPYPFNVFYEPVSWSGVLGTFYPDGRFELLDTDTVEMRKFAKQPPKRTRFWSDSLATFVEGELVWDGAVNGGIEIPDDPEKPMRRLWDASITGPWPNHPPRAERIVNPEKAREAYAEAERDRREWN